MTNKDDSISPQQKTCTIDCVTYPYGFTTGLTKREYFAALALQGVISSKVNYSFPFDSELAVKYADALIEALNKEKTNG